MTHFPKPLFFRGFFHFYGQFLAFPTLRQNPRFPSVSGWCCRVILHGVDPSSLSASLKLLSTTEMLKTATASLEMIGEKGHPVNG